MAITSPELPGDKTKTFNNVQINVDFTEESTRSKMESGEKINTLFGKISKWLTDLKTVAFSGSYKDLTDTPTEQIEALPILRIDKKSANTTFIYVNVQDLTNDTKYILDTTSLDEITSIIIIYYVFVCDDDTEFKICQMRDWWVPCMRHVVPNSIVEFIADLYTYNRRFKISLSDTSTANSLYVTASVNKRFLDVSGEFEYTPSLDYQPATKKYVDDSISSIQIPEQVQPDWSQSDSTQPDYIKNRPFYGDITVHTINEEFTFSIVELPKGVTVSINDVTWRALLSKNVTNLAINSTNSLVFGSEGDASIQYVDSAEEFYISVSKSSSQINVVSSNFWPEDPVSMAITGTWTEGELVKIPEKYLPTQFAEDIPYDENLGRYIYTLDVDAFPVGNTTKRIAANFDGVTSTGLYRIKIKSSTNETVIGFSITNYNSFIDCAILKGTKGSAKIYLTSQYIKRTYFVDDAGVITSESTTQTAVIDDIPSDDHINSLIDAKLGVIENGAY